MHAVCIASGPSLTEEDVGLVRKWREAGENRLVIVTNNTAILCPWADAMMARDLKWWTVMGKDVESFKGLKFCGFQGVGIPVPKTKLGGNSGVCAMLLAKSMGATRITLLGYDCKVGADGKRHWHGKHRRGLGDAVSLPKFYGQFVAIIPDMRGLTVRNSSRDTDLDIWPAANLEDELA